MKWDLESILNRKKLPALIASFAKKLNKYTENKLELVDKIVSLQVLAAELSELSHYIDCLLVQDVTDDEAKQKESLIQEKQAALDTELLKVSQELARLNEKQFLDLVRSEKLQHLHLFLHQLRKLAQERASLPIENIFLQLSLDGFHSWFGMYQELVGGMRVKCKIKGKMEELSSAQADNFLANPDRAVRKEVFTKWTQACADNKMRFARILNYISGFRLKMCAERGWKSPLKEPLHTNNMDEDSLNAMWDAISDVQSIMKPFYQEKAKIYRLKKLSWFDLEAPLDKNEKKHAYLQIASQFPKELQLYSSDCARFAQKAIEKKWLDVATRKNKAPGGFCVPLPLSKESRIYLSYTGSFHNDLVVAHELGHSYHNDVVFDLPYYAQKYPMNLAEMASTFFEHVHIDALLQQAKTKNDQKKVLFEKVQRHTFLLQNIYARFLFEKELYDKRLHGFLLPDQLSEMMRSAQIAAYGDIFETYHDYFWITKLHFYLTNISFYNFPYTIGYLLSLLLLQHAKKDPNGFEKHVQALLLDTGRKNLQEIVRAHFSHDSRDPKFWRQALDIVAYDVKQFMDL